MKTNFFMIVTTAILVGLLSVPLPSAEATPTPAVASTSKAKSKTKPTSRLHRLISRFRGGVPTYADSFSLDDPAYDDPMVRQAAVEGLGKFHGSVVAVDPYS